MIAIVVAVVLAIGCGNNKNAASEDRGRAPDMMKRKPSEPLAGAVVIVLDTVRADHMSCYGHTRQTTPAIDKLAAKGIRFDQAISLAPWTLPSIASMLSGLPPDLAMNDKRRLKRSIVQEISQAGYTTSGITEGGFVSKYFGMDIGFSHYYEAEGAVRLRHGNTKDVEPDRNDAGGIETTFAKAKAWLSDNYTESFMLFIHTYEAHTPYTNHYFTDELAPGRIGPVFKIEYLDEIRNDRLKLDESERHYVEALYDGDIRSTDHYVEDFLDFMADLGLDQKTLVVITSDHGEELGDHHRRFSYDHGHSLKDDMLRVPLIIYHPTATYHSKTVDVQVGLHQVLPTVAEILEVPLPDEFARLSLCSVMDGVGGVDRPLLSGGIKAGPQRYSLRNSGYKFIKVFGPQTEDLDVPDIQLYNLIEDPHEYSNIADAEPAIADKMSRQLEKAVNQLKQNAQSMPSTVEDDALLNRLRSLGYLK